MSRPIRPDRRSVLLAIAAGLAATGTAVAATEPNPVPIELFEEALELQAAVRLGNSRGDVTLVEFFDYNCPFCKRSAGDLPGLLAAEPDLSYVLVNYAVLGAASVQATRVALAFSETEGPGRYLALHQALFGLRGPVDGPRALGEAETLGADIKRLTGLADSDLITTRMKEALRVGSSLGLVATPSLVVGPEAYLGAVTFDEKRAIIARARA